MYFSYIVRNSEDRDSQEKVCMTVNKRDLVAVNREHLLRAKEVSVHVPLMLAEEVLHFLEVGLGSQIVAVDCRKEDVRGIDRAFAEDSLHVAKAIILVRCLSGRLPCLQLMDGEAETPETVLEKGK